jgi:hypothetical protein
MTAAKLMTMSVVAAMTMAMVMVILAIVVTKYFVSGKDGSTFLTNGPVTRQK